MAEKIAVGIDLGTTNSCVAVVRQGRVEIIANEQGHRITPSVVAFTDVERLIGDAAKAQATWNPENTIFEVKRLIGRKFNDPSLQSIIKHWPFKVVDVGGNPKIELEFKEERKVFTPEEISAMVLAEMKKIAETYLGHPVKDAVITVPAYFNDSQRQATIDAGTIAGLNVLKIINEPTAAAIAYGVDTNVREKRNILIYDLGGGTFDVVVMSIEEGVFDVKAVGGNTHLGGGDFDNLLVEHFAQEFKNKFKMDLTKNKKSIGKLRKAVEVAKRNLAVAIKDRIAVESLYEGVDFTSNISRVRFENICSSLFEGTVKVVEDVLLESGLQKSEIHEVVLAGGSTRIVKLQQLLSACFDGKKINKTINPDEAVAYGAAIHAASLVRDCSVKEVFLRDVTPLSLGIKLHDGTMEFVIPKNTKIPCLKKHNFTTVKDYMTSQVFNVYEGERRIADNNYHLGQFLLNNIQYASKGVPSFEVTCEIDCNGILHVSAVDKKTLSESAITITTNKGRLKKEEIERMVVEASDYQQADLDQRKRDRAREALEAACFKCQATLDKTNGRRISEARRSRLTDTCNGALAWVEDHLQATAGEFMEKKDELEQLCISFGVELDIVSDEEEIE